MSIYKLIRKKCGHSNMNEYIQNKEVVCCAEHFMLYIQYLQCFACKTRRSCPMLLHPADALLDACACCIHLTWMSMRRHSGRMSQASFRQNEPLVPTGGRVVSTGETMAAWATHPDCWVSLLHPLGWVSMGLRLVIFVSGDPS